jgi:hypothetical protein
VALLVLALVSLVLVIWRKRNHAEKSSQEDHRSNSGDHFADNPREMADEVSEGSEESYRISNENKQSGSVDYLAMAYDPHVKSNRQTTGPDISPVELKDEPKDLGDESYIANDQYETNKEVPERDESIKAVIEITSEMAAVMETLTSRERAVLMALIEHSGKMNQADIRYETSIPKSSLTGILLSLERRKLITKKEKGRTNFIELSEWFLSKKDSPEPDND